MVPVTASVAFVVELLAPMPTLPVMAAVPCAVRPAERFMLLAHSAPQRNEELPMSNEPLEFGLKLVFTSPLTETLSALLSPRLTLLATFRSPVALAFTVQTFDQRLLELPTL